MLIYYSCNPFYVNKLHNPLTIGRRCPRFVNNRRSIHTRRFSTEFACELWAEEEMGAFFAPHAAELELSDAPSETAGPMGEVPLLFSSSASIRARVCLIASLRFISSLTRLSA